MSQKKRKRYLWADVIRIIAIFLVIVVHSSGPIPPIDLRAQIQLAVTIIVRAGVPLFVMLSGALLLDKQEKYSTFFLKRFSTLIPPWCFWAIASAVILSPKHQLSFSTFRQYVLFFWFLPMIVGIYLLTPTIRIFVKRAKTKDLVYLISIWFMIVSVLPFTRNTLAFPKLTDGSLLRQVINFSGYYLLGYLIINKKIYKKIKLLPTLLITILGVSWISLQLNLSHPSGWIPNNAWLFYNSPGIIIVSLGMFLLIYHLTEILKPKLENSKQIVSTSKLILGIFLSHNVVQKILRDSFDWYPISNKYLFYAIVNAIVLFLASYTLIYLLSRIPVIRKVVS